MQALALILFEKTWNHFSRFVFNKSTVSMTTIGVYCTVEVHVEPYL